MSAWRRHRPRVAPVVALLALLLTAGTATFAQEDLRDVVIVVPFALVGGLLGARRPDNPVGWLFLGFGALAAINFFAGNYADQALDRHPGSLPGADVAASVAAHWWHASFGFFVLAFLLFPSGRLLSPRWRWVARAAVVVYGGLALSGPFDGDMVHEEFPRADTLVHGAAERVGTVVFGVFLTVNLLILLLAGASLLVRLRRSTGDERQQVKWFVCPVAATMILFPTSVLVFGDGRYGVWLFPLIPAAAAVAILRYRLYDIDVVVNRALVYTALTATLVGAYLVTVLLAQLVLPERSSLGVAVSTLLAAALFAPARRRIQAGVDRRFFRRRYDAAQTLVAFGATLRDQVDLETLSEELRGVVADTVQPAHVSLWLRTS